MVNIMQLLDSILAITVLLISSFELIQRSIVKIISLKVFDSISEGLGWLYEIIFSSFTIVLEDEKKILYSFIKIGENIKKMTLDKRSGTITISDAEVDSLDRKVKTARSSDALAFSYIAKKAFSDYEKVGAQNNITEKDSLVMRLLQKKSKSNTVTYLCLLASLLLEFIVYSYFSVSNNWITLFLCALLILLYLKQLVLKFRVKCGLYGTCYLEAKEIISYILSNQKKNGRGSGTPKLVFPEGEIEQKILNPNWGGEYAQ